jgi:hypothetical protein
MALHHGNIFDSLGWITSHTTDVGMGVVQLNLPIQTKSSQSRTADVVIAYETASVKNLGWWLDTLWALLPYRQRVPNVYIVCHATGTPWTSHFYSYNYVYPLLALQRTLGDPYLTKSDEPPGKASRPRRELLVFQHVPEGRAQSCLAKEAQQPPRRDTGRSCQTWPSARQPEHSRHANRVFGMVDCRSNGGLIFLYVSKGE